MHQPTVLVVDDEPKIRDIVRRYLEADGFAVIEQGDGPGALSAAREQRPDLVVLDVMLPGLDGVEVLRRLRETSQIPVILLTARDEEVDKLIGLAVGADDYVTKPFSGRELAARARVILRRVAPAPPEAAASATVSHGALTIDPARREVTTAHGPATVTALDFDLLLTLARHPGLVLTRRQLLQSVWGADYYGDERVVDVHIRTLRKALGDDATDPVYIETVRSIGYRLIAPPPG
ncbi:response regulator transcription factor [Actinospica sp.]|uniref:response regulator transcription factor n=1 Tax=Actinospica sp. TaxID=1872142 RepID=UPI002D127191|nr:response regulator transcription factor [Actinospica sp.]HWG27452.1 response regulator transcription factor [Actinospica sp.]